MPLLGSDNNLNVTINTEAKTGGLTAAEEKIAAFSQTANKLSGQMGVTTKKSGEAAGGISKLGSTTDEAEPKVRNLGGSFVGLWKSVAGGVLASNVVQSAISLMTSSIGDAIKRVDTLNNANRTFQNMGFHADNVKKSMDALNKSILGLPTPLDQAVNGVTLLASANNNLGQAQKVYSALNDAILGFGGNTVDVNNAVLQLSQDMAGGVLHAQTWNSLLQSGVGPTLAAMARQMGITTAALRNGLSDGSISVDKFSKALISMDVNGGGGLKSLHKIAMDSTNGIATSMANAHTAITRALANILQSIGQANIASAINAIGKAAATAITFIGGLVGFVGRFVDWGSAIGDVTKAFKILWTGLSGGDATMTGAGRSWDKFGNIVMALHDDLVHIGKYLTVGFKEALSFMKIAFEALSPSILALWSTVVNKLYPSLTKLWQFIEPVFIPLLKVVAGIIGFTVVGAVYILVNALNVLLSVITPVMNFIASHKQLVIDLAVAFGGLALAMKFDSITSAFTANMNTIMGSISGVKGRVVDLFTKISGGTVMGGIATAGAMADIALVSQAVQSVLGAINAMNQSKNAIVKATDQAGAIKYEEQLYAQHKISKTQETKAINALLAGVDSATRQAHHAVGGLNFAGGGTWVGEQGPEWVELPRGSNIYTNAQSKSMEPKASNKNVTINQTNHFSTQYDPSMAAQELGFRLMRA